MHLTAASARNGRAPEAPFFASSWGFLLCAAAMAAACSNGDQEPRRMLVESPGLMGESPVDNRVLDPFFTLDTGAWTVVQMMGDGSLYDGQFGLFAHHQVPGGLDRALVIEPGVPGIPVVTGILTRLGTDTSFTAQVWLGLEQDEAGLMPDLLVWVTGQDMTSGEISAVSLSPDSPELSADSKPGLVWRRFAGTVPPVFDGEGMLYVNAPSWSPARVYVASPSVSPLETATGVRSKASSMKLSPAPPGVAKLLGRLGKGGRR